MTAPGKLYVLPSFWAVGPKCPYPLRVTTVRYDEGKHTVWGLQIECMKQRPFFFTSPLFMLVLNELSLGTYMEEKVYQVKVH